MTEKEDFDLSSNRELNLILANLWADSKQTDYPILADCAERMLQLGMKLVDYVEDVIIENVKLRAEVSNLRIEVNRMKKG